MAAELESFKRGWDKFMEENPFASFNGYMLPAEPQPLCLWISVAGEYKREGMLVLMFCW